MVEYTITLGSTIKDCENCPLRAERMFNEHIESRYTMTGTVAITRKESFCSLTMEKLDKVERVGAYGSKCPLPLGKEVK